MVTVSSAVSVCLLFFCPLITCWSLCPVLYLSVFSSSVRSSRVGHCVQCCICVFLLLFTHHVCCVSAVCCICLLFFCSLITCWSLCPVLYLSSLLLFTHRVLVTVSSAVSVCLLLLPHRVLVTVSSAVSVCLLFFCHSSRVGHCVQCCICLSSLLLSSSRVGHCVQCCICVFSSSVHSSRVGHCVQCCICVFSSSVHSSRVGHCVQCCICVFSSSVRSSRVGHCVQCCICVFSSSVHSSRVGHCVQCCICPSSLLLSPHRVLVTVSSAVSVCLLFFCPLIACWSLCPVLYLSVFSSSVHSSRVGHCVQCCICVFSSSVHSSRVGHCVQCRVCLSSLLLSTHHMLVTVSSAVSVGTEMLEMDCHLTSDGCVVVSHDNNLLRQTGYDKTVSSLRFQVFILTNKPALFISI